MLERFEGSDGLAAIFPRCSMRSSPSKPGLSWTTIQVLRAEKELKRLQNTKPPTSASSPVSPVWDTAIVEHLPRESGVPAEDPRMKKAAEWLMGKEIRFGATGSQEPGQSRAQRLGV